jgi:iron complex outermembrane recepter protein
VLTDGIDLNLVYDVDVTGLDALRFTTDVTHIIQYDIQTEDGTIKAAGNRNEQNFARALPKWRVNTGMVAELGAHTGGLTVRYVSSYEDDDNANVRIDDHTTVDLFYAFQFSNIDATLQVGVIDLFDREPPFVNTDFNFDSRTHDARGRRIYSYLRWRF